MESHFILTTVSDCKLQIVDQSDYVKESTITDYSFSDSVSLNLLYNNQINNDILIKQEVLDHSDIALQSKQYNYIATEDADNYAPIDDNYASIDDNYIALESKDISEFQLKNDGKLTAYHFIIPTKQWLNKFTSEVLFQTYPILIYYDNGQFYKSIDGGVTSELITYELIKEINPITTNIAKCKKPTFSICFLYKCYINYCKQILEQNISKCITKDSDLIFKRDFVWMTINVIKYYLDLKQLSEAQRLLEETMSCNGFCKSSFLKYSLTNNTVSGCGCGN